MATLTPSSPRRMAMAWPIPELPPVTSGAGPIPGVAEERRRFGHGADLAEGAGGPERSVPERRVARRRAVVRAHVQIRLGNLVIAG